VGHFQEEEKPLPESEANDLRYNEYQAAVFSRRSDSTHLDSSPCVRYQSRFYLCSNPHIYLYPCKFVGALKYPNASPAAGSKSRLIPRVDAPPRRSSLRMKVLLEFKQRVGECAYVEARYNRIARSRTETQGIPQCRSRRAHQRMRRVAETFPLGVLVHLLKESQVTNRQKQYRHERRGSGDRERRKERMPAEVHVHLTNLRKGAQ
jgi:hypothetical protein